ncbi:hypothetical protein BDZ89DRAFT_1071930 [Hymenopellis radicata]|nr:hypothetical protein BDZ89DRAFT_1071930 [Hymenopellis radicata]
MSGAFVFTPTSEPLSFALPTYSPFIPSPSLFPGTPSPYTAHVPLPPAADDSYYDGAGYPYAYPYPYPQPQGNYYPQSLYNLYTPPARHTSSIPGSTAPTRGATSGSTCPPPYSRPCASSTPPGRASPRAPRPLRARHAPPDVRAPHRARRVPVAHAHRHGIDAAIVGRCAAVGVQVYAVEYWS